MLKLSSFHLKILGAISMVIDHIGKVFLYAWFPTQAIGRLAMPIFSHLIVQGFLHTKDFNKYIIRMLFFAFSSEIIFDLFFYQRLFFWGHQNILFTFTLSLAGLRLFKKLKKQNILVAYLIIPAFAVTAQYLYLDYGAYGIMVIFTFYILRNKKKYLPIVIGLISLFWEIYQKPIMMYYPEKFNFLTPYVVISIFILLLYSGKRGLRVKYLFYIFYPAHMIILYTTLKLTS